MRRRSPPGGQRPRALRLTRSAVRSLLTGGPATTSGYRGRWASPPRRREQGNRQAARRTENPRKSNAPFRYSPPRVNLNPVHRHLTVAVTALLASVTLGVVCPGTRSRSFTRSFRCPSRTRESRGGAGAGQDARVRRRRVRRFSRRCEWPSVATDWWPGSVIFRISSREVRAAVRRFSQPPVLEDLGRPRARRRRSRRRFGVRPAPSFWRLESHASRLDPVAIARN